MGTGASRLVLLGVLLLSGCEEAHQQGRCVMQEVADLPVLNDHAQPVIKAQVNGVPVAFIVDTGAAVSLVTPRGAALLSLPVDYDHRVLMQGTGGSVFAYGAELRSLDLGSSVAHNVEFTVAGGFDGTVDGLTLVGLFGADFLANYDVAFDLPAHHVGLYKEQNCAADFPSPWGSGATRLPYDLQKDTQIHLSVSLDGHPVDMQLDSGAGYTMLDLESAHAAGASADALSHDRTLITRGIDENRTRTAVHRFGSLVIGSERFAPVLLEVGDIDHALLGANLLRTHRVWISYPHQVLWMQAVRRGFSLGVPTVPAGGVPGGTPIKGGAG